MQCWLIFKNFGAIQLNGNFRNKESNAIQKQKKLMHTIYVAQSKLINRYVQYNYIEGVIQRETEKTKEKN